MNIILSNDDLVKVPEGADPAAVRKMHENRLAREALRQAQDATNPRKPRRSKPRRTSKREQRTRTFQALTGKATLQLVERVNGEPEAEPETDSWYTIKTADYTAKVDRETGEVAYEDN